MSRRPYVRKQSRSLWWTSQPLYVRYMLREFSSLLIGAYVLALIVGLYQLSRGPEAFAAFVSAASGTLGLTIAAVVFIFAAYHTYTWFQVTPKAMPITVAGRRLPGIMIIAGHWLGFAVVSGLLWMLTGVST